MDEVGIILLTLFLFLLVFGPLICLTYDRVRDHRKFHPRTSQFRDARRKLSTVSECTTIGREKLDVESNLNQHDAGPECPICIGPLFVSSSGNATGGSPIQAMPSCHSGSGGGSGVLEACGGGSGGGGEEGEGGQAQRGVGSVKKKLAALKWRAKQLWTTRTQRSSDESADHDILTLKNCQHAFHAKCLSSWFLIERYDCPVCRSQYWQTRESRARAASAPPGPVPDPASGLARPAPARLVVERFSVSIM